MTMQNEETQTIQTEIMPLAKRCEDLVIRNDEEKDVAVKLVKSMKDLKKNIEERFHPTQNKQIAYKSYTQALDTETEFYSPIDNAIKLLTGQKGKITIYETEKSQKAQREAQEAEAKRQEAERKEREKLEAKANKAEEKGKVEQAEAFREQAKNVTIAPVFIPPTNGVKKLVWKAECSNLFNLCQSIAEGKVPFSVVEIRQSALNDFAKNHDGKSVIPGLKFFQVANNRV